MLNFDSSVDNGYIEFFFHLLFCLNIGVFFDVEPKIEAEEETTKVENMDEAVIYFN